MAKHITSFISQQFGKFATKEFAHWFQKIVNRSYVSLMGLDMQEFHEADTYKSLNALFTRKLREDREFSLEGDQFIAPCDSLITEAGKLQNAYALQIKGMRYESGSLLGKHFTAEEKALVEEGEFINFYLSPRDYHRYHMPTNLKVLKAVHIPGKLYPVNFPSLKKRLDLFIENERVILLCETQKKQKLFLVLVGALNVGKMQVSFEKAIQTNADAQESSVYEYENLYLDKGEDFGCFEMGSTVVVLAQKDMLELNVDAGEKVRYGQSIAKLI